MKMKSFAMIALVGLLTVPFAYIAPAMADDTISDGQTIEPPTDNGTQNDMNPTTNSNDNLNNTNINPGNSDTGMPDTATGDDDY